MLLESGAKYWPNRLDADRLGITTGPATLFTCGLGEKSCQTWRALSHTDCSQVGLNQIKDLLLPLKPARMVLDLHGKPHLAQASELRLRLPFQGTGISIGHKARAVGRRLGHRDVHEPHSLWHSRRAALSTRAAAHTRTRRT